MRVLLLIAMTVVSVAQRPLPKVLILEAVPGRHELEEPDETLRWNPVRFYNRLASARFECVSARALLLGSDPRIRCVLGTWQDVRKITRFVERGGGAAFPAGAVGGEDRLLMDALLGVRPGSPLRVHHEGRLVALDPDHPAARVVDGFTLREGRFISSVPRVALADGARPIIGIGDEVVAWTRAIGKGRVIVSGIELDRLSPAQVLAHQVESIAWAGRVGPFRIAPKSATVLFDGTSTRHWIAEQRGEPCPWKLVDGTLEVSPGKGSIMTRETYGDFQMHVEFRVPEGAGGSGVYLQRRYELQILNTPGRETEPHYCGALFRYRAPDLNATFPVKLWQTYDITFRQPRWKDGKKTKNARITVVHNGLTIHNDVALTRSTSAGKKESPAPMPVLLEDHGFKVQFRNIWIDPLH